MCTITICGSLKLKTDMIRLWHEFNKSKLCLAYLPTILIDGYVIDNDDKEILRITHFNRIQQSDKIVVLTDDNGYIGDDTTIEIKFAKDHNIPVTYIKVSEINLKSFSVEFLLR